MRIAIYGAGNYGQYVYNEIRSHNQAKVSVVFWIDNFVNEQERCGLPIYTVENFLLNHKSEEVDVVVVAIDPPSIAYKAASSLLMCGYKLVYIAMPRGFKPKIPVLDEEGYFSPFIKYHNLYEEMKPMIPRIEVPVTHYCNLNCKRCSNFSNLVTEKNFLDLNILERDLRQLKTKIKGMSLFALLGGEPLLNPQLDICISLVRKYFPDASIEIVTNGLLIPKIPLKLIDTMKQCNAHFWISQYIPTRKKLHSIVDFLEKNQIAYEVTPPRNEFKKILTFKEEDGKKAFEYNSSDMCTCHVLDNGRIYLCGNFPRLYALQDYFNIHIGEDELKENSIDLFNDEIDGWDIIQYFKCPTSLCRFCCPGDLWYPWETGEAKKEDWIAD